MLEPATLAVVVLAAFLGGFTTGFAGFGTALVASGLWFYVLPAHVVPPLIAMTSVAAHLIGLATVRNAFDWPRAWPYLVGGALGVPLGVLAFSHASPGLLRTAVGAFLIVYPLAQFGGLAKLRFKRRPGRAADAAVGVGGGVLGGFAALSGPLPIVWLQLQGGPSSAQRAVYQPFNLVVLSVAATAMALNGQLGREVLLAAGLCAPTTVIGAFVGGRIYLGVSEDAFKRVVMALLLASGVVLVAREAIG